MNKKRQSNRIEYCPFCLRELKNRMSATSHYRAHARKGETIQHPSGEAWQLKDDDKAVWWSRGFRRTSYKPLEEQRRDYLNHLWVEGIKGRGEIWE